eukprot:Platyproteum_vivax@DN6014_c0_g1_i2.p1
MRPQASNNFAPQIGAPINPPSRSPSQILAPFFSASQRPYNGVSPAPPVMGQSRSSGPGVNPFSVAAQRASSLPITAKSSPMGLPAPNAGANPFFMGSYTPPPPAYQANSQPALFHTARSFLHDSAMSSRQISQRSPHPFVDSFSHPLLPPRQLSRMQSPHLGYADQQTAPHIALSASTNNLAKKRPTFVQCYGLCTATRNAPPVSKTVLQPSASMTARAFPPPLEPVKDFFPPSVSVGLPPSASVGQMPLPPHLVPSVQDLHAPPAVVPPPLIPVNAPIEPALLREEEIGETPCLLDPGKPRIKWGICGTGRICQDFTQLLKARSADVELLAVGASSFTKALKFATRFKIPRVYGSYEELASDEDVQVIYVGTINSMHFANVMTMFNCDRPKHVLCEKPLGVTLREVKQMVTKALAVGRILLEGLSTRFFPCFKEIRRCIADGEIGEVTSVTAEFGMVAPPDFYRVHSEELGGGALLDVGGYAIQYANMVFGHRPDETKACGLLSSKTGVDLTTAACMHWRGKGVAQIVYGIQGWFCNECRIVGSGGLIRVRDSLHTPTSFDLRKYQNKGDYVEETITWNVPTLGSGASRMHYPKSECMIYEIAEMNRIISVGELETPEYTYEEMLNVHAVMEQIRIELGTAVPYEDGPEDFMPDYDEFGNMILPNEESNVAAMTIQEEGESQNDDGEVQDEKLSNKNSD